MAAMIGLDPHKGSHTGVAVDENERNVDEVRVRSGPKQLDRLLEWAARFPERTCALESATGLGYLLAQQLVSHGERVIDVQPKLAARVRLLATESTNKNDPHDARSVAIAALRSPSPRYVQAEDHAAEMRLWSKRQRDLSQARNRVACRLHSVLCDLVAGGVPEEITAGKAASLVASLEPQTAVAAARVELAHELIENLRRLDAQMKESKKRLEVVVEASGTTPRRSSASGRRSRHRGRDRRRDRPIRQPGPLRRLQRHRARRGVLRRAHDLPAVPTGQSPDEPRHPRGGHDPDPVPPQPRAGLLRPRDGRGQDPQGGPSRPQAPYQRRCSMPAWSPTLAKPQPPA